MLQGAFGPLGVPISVISCNTGAFGPWVTINSVTPLGPWAQGVLCLTGPTGPCVTLKYRAQRALVYCYCVTPWALGPRDNCYS